MPLPSDRSNQNSYISPYDQGSEFVQWERNAHSVSQVKRTNCDPERTASSQARLASCCSALGWYA
jgi:hypothetical protein